MSRIATETKKAVCSCSAFVFENRAAPLKGERVFEKTNKDSFKVNIHSTSYYYSFHFINLSLIRVNFIGLFRLFIQPLGCFG